MTGAPCLDQQQWQKPGQEAAVAAAMVQAPAAQAVQGLS
jgi:hypothetical protein